MNKIAGRFTITEAQHHAFAALSGDYNPLHVDRVHARRLQFGRPVIHGIHHLLPTWDQAAAQPALAERRLAGLRAAFPSSAFVDEPIEYSGTLSEGGRTLDLRAHSRGNLVLTLGLTFDDAARPRPRRRRTQGRPSNIQSNRRSRLPSPRARCRCCWSARAPTNSSPL